MILQMLFGSLHLFDVIAIEAMPEQGQYGGHDHPDIFIDDLNAFEIVLQFFFCRRYTARQP